MDLSDLNNYESFFKLYASEVLIKISTEQSTKNHELLIKKYLRMWSDCFRIYKNDENLNLKEISLTWNEN